MQITVKILLPGGGEQVVTVDSEATVEQALAAADTNALNAVVRVRTPDGANAVLNPGDRVVQGVYAVTKEVNNG